VAKLELNETTAEPTEETSGVVNGEFTAVDSQGRAVAFRRPDPLKRLAFSKAIGNNGSAYRDEVMPLSLIYSVDGVRVANPKSDKDLDALYVKFADETDVLIAAMNAFGEVEAAKQDEADLKNS
jgi:hypothetical protein